MTEKREAATGPRADATRVLPQSKGSETSPVDPTVGRIVHYYPTNTELIQFASDAQRAGSLLHGVHLGKTPVAGVITASTPDDRVNLRLLLDSSAIPPRVTQVLYSEAPFVGRWSWPPLVQRRTSDAS